MTSIEYKGFKYVENNSLFIQDYSSSDSLSSKIIDLDNLMLRLSQFQRVFLATSFMKESLVLTDVVDRLRLPIPMIYVDFGVISDEFESRDYGVYAAQRERCRSYSTRCRVIHLKYDPRVHVLRQPIPVIRSKVKSGFLLIDGSYPAEACPRWTRFWWTEKDKKRWGLSLHCYGSHQEIHPLWCWTLDDTLAYLERYDLLSLETVSRTSKRFI